MLPVAEKVRVKAAQVGLLPVPPLLPLVKSSPGRAWLAARALPRHASQVSTWAIGEKLLLPSATFYSSMAVVIGHLVMIGCTKLTDLACDAAI
jgi:hypothetical protein